MIEQPFHAGELAVQARAGVQAEAQRVARVLAAHIPEDYWDLIESLPLLIVGSTAQSAGGGPWISALCGPAGFVRVESHTRLRIQASLAHDARLRENLLKSTPLGLLFIDLASRKRYRVNGVVTHADALGFALRVEVAFGNCPKYIQRRAFAWATQSQSAADAPQARCGALLNAAQRDWIRRADTFFIASAHADEPATAAAAGQGRAGVDASHRGGNPGFIQVRDDGVLQIPDYSGNNMFQTLGNLELDPRAALLFIDFERGDTLQLSGIARVDWDPRAAAALPGARRVLRFEPELVCETRGAIALRAAFGGYSPFNPI